jgi:23S rRNA (uracil1939-C5)-methyltransferase
MNSGKGPFRLGETAELTVESLAFGGKGVARRDGFVIFVEGAVPGDRVRAVVTRTRPSYAEARALEVLNPSEERVEPRCHHFGDCGGCSWQTLRYDIQLRYKGRQVGECLRHIGGLEGFAVDEPVGARPLWRYRNKVEFSFGGSGEALVLGFHKPGRWQELTGVDDCLLHSELTNDIRNHIRDFARASGEPAYDQRGGSGFWRHLVLREGLGTGEVMVNIVTAPGSFPAGDELVRGIGNRFPQVVSLLWSINDTRASVASGFPYTVMAGRDHIHESIGGLRLKLSPSSFLQTNTAMAELLYQKALGFAGLTGGETVLDLYSGIGSIALLAAGSCQRVLGVEVMKEAVALARENAAANHIGNARFQSSKVRVALKGSVLEGRPDLVILDPPRAGAGKKEIIRILSLEAPRIVYVSCNPSTLAGNARQLTEGGYRLVRTVAVDMFPHTPHIETVALLERDA